MDQLFKVDDFIRRLLSSCGSSPPTFYAVWFSPFWEENLDWMTRWNCEVQVIAETDGDRVRLAAQQLSSGFRSRHPEVVDQCRLVRLRENGQWTLTAEKWREMIG